MSYYCLSDKAEVPVILSDPGSAWQEQEQDWIFGESLPTGLVLLATVEEQEPAAPNSPESL